MRDLYEQLIQGGEAAIQQLKDERFQEEVQLEFKRKARPSEGGLTKEDRQNLGIVLSAMSNSMGGVVVWGVVAKKNQDDVDCASELQPIAQIAKFKSDVERAVSQALMPKHDGIKIEKIASSTLPGAGYLVMHVERSERRPHRNEYGEKQYFKRIGDSNIAMEHYDIEDAFKRFVVPNLDVGVSLSHGGRRGDDLLMLRVTLMLNNNSSVSATYPYLIIDERSPYLTPVFTAGQNVPGRFSGGASDVIHPDLQLTAIEIQREIRVTKMHPDGYAYLAKGALEPPMEIKFRCGCLNSRPRSGAVQITEGEIVKTLGITVVQS
jgi:hypothetical protein